MDFADKITNGVSFAYKIFATGTDKYCTLLSVLVTHQLSLLHNGERMINPKEEILRGQ